MDLGRLRSPEVGGGALLVPLGSCEQHGPHLPLGTDTLIAERVTEALARRLPGALVAPAIAIGASGEHAAFAGTLSIGREALELVLVELGRSADRFAGLLVVNGHGGNSAALRGAVDLLVAEGRHAGALSCSVPGGDAHAGRTETSLLLWLEPSLVRVDRAEPGSTEPWEAIGGRVVADGVGAVSPNGVLGDPTGASAEEGEQLFADLVDRLAAVAASMVARWSDDRARVHEPSHE